MTDLDSTGPVVWPKWCYANAQTESVELPSGLSLTPASKQRRRNKALDTVDVKRESRTPDRSPSGSPRSLVSQRSPHERRSPATPASVAATPPVTSQAAPPRNYSDFMRSLAAKYNNNSPNEYFAGQQNGLLRGFDYSRYGLKPGHTPLLPTSPKDEKKDDTTTAAAAAAAAAANPLLAVHPHLAALSGLPMLDVLSMVRPSLTPADYLASSQTAAGATTPTGKRPAEGTPLDLSNMKRPRLEKGFKELFGLKEEESRAGSASPRPAAEPASLHGSACSQKPCSAEAEAVAAWGVDEVCSFVRSVDVCAEYTEAFKEHGIDGSTLPLLSAEHLTNILNMKLGPALKLRTALSQKIGYCATCMHCSHCHATPKAVAKSFLPFAPATKGQ